MKIQSVMPSQERFTRVQTPRIQRSQFDRSFGHKTTIEAGKLYPLYLDFAIPGDTFNVQPTIFGRTDTLLKPIMDNGYIDIQFFSVPYRLIFDKFVNLMGEQANPDDTIDYLLPQMDAPEGGYDELTIQDYFGLPTKVENFSHSTLPLRAYNLIWNEWYRDQDIQDSVTFSKGETGTDDINDFNLLYRNKRKDYFTSARPWAQKASPVTIPLLQNQTIPVTSTGIEPQFETTISGTTGYLSALPTPSPDPGYIKLSSTPPGTTEPMMFGDTTGLEAIIDESVLGTINQLRESATLQQFLEIDARGGTRYPELIYNHFGVTSPDARLQRPEYLGGGSSPINVNPVAQNSESSTTPQGNLSAMGTYSISNKGFTKTFTEHEVIIGLVSVRADLNYQQGLNRHWSHETRYDLFWPSFANLGEQPILQKELVCTLDGTGNDDVFGYNERYSEYRYKPSQITGLFRSNATQSLDIWHLAQDFSAAPTLSDLFLRENPPFDRVVATPTEPPFIIDSYFKNIAARPIPMFSTPGLERL